MWKTLTQFSLVVFSCLFSWTVRVRKERSLQVLSVPTEQTESGGMRSQISPR